MRPSRPCRARTVSALCLAWLLTAGASGPGCRADEAPTLRQALAEGEPRLSLRYRFEGVEDEGVGDREAVASTLRFVLGYETASYRGWSLFAEAENVTVVGDERGYRNAAAGGLSNGVTDRPTVADPEITELNQAFARYRNDRTVVTLGRQEILLGDVRFVGNVGWRQNHQAFDAVRVEHRLTDRATLSYAFIDRVHRIFGDRADLAAHALRVGRELPAAATLTAYAYLLDYEEATDAASSTATYGIELVGSRELASRKLLYELEWAEQRDHADNPGSVDAGYGHGMVGAGLGCATLKAGWEVLEGGPGRGSFSTPLATLHKFNGWADKFLRTPADGLEDLYLSVDGKVGRASWVAVLHDFRAESSDARYGRELDLQLMGESSWGQSFGLKAAIYDARDLAADTEKLMLWTSYAF